MLVAETNRIDANMRNLRKTPDEPYAAHTRGRNSFAVGISVMAMERATPQDFGRYPLTEELIDGLCVVAARVAGFYGVPIEPGHVMTHAEAAVADGYFGTAPEERWDIARLQASPAALRPAEAAQTGDRLRRRIARQ